MPTIHGAVGTDGIPDHISADRASPYFWLPIRPARLVVYCNGERLSDVVEADRRAGWVRTKHMMTVGNGVRQQVTDRDGDPLERMYTGRVTFALEHSADRLNPGRRLFALTRPS
jgi:hypothetical protein